ncbi:hypothetical protein MMC07_004708 [Pseudocyphellaria aurata]|nr:hypothetical protein [Pseudocyphellaria aurata]
MMFLADAGPYRKNAKAVYFLTNEAKNSVVALKVHADGSLSDGSITLTGGSGASGISSMNNATAGPDSLFSQSALKAEGNMLVAVNPGSNTVSLFTISRADPTVLTLVGKPASTMGEFPVSVALSIKKKLACVANGGAKAGLACFRISAKTGLIPLSEKLLTTFNIGQSTPPIGPLNSISHTLFNADASALITTVKGDPSTKNTGFVSVLPIQYTHPVTPDIRSSPNGTAVLFGSAIIPSNPSSLHGPTVLFATDAAFGTTTLSLSSSFQFSSFTKTTISGQIATCWSTFSPFTRTAFVTDVVKNRLVEIDPVTGNILQTTTLPNNNRGMIDLASAGRFIYALSPATPGVQGAVVVVEVGNGAARQVQNFVLNTAGSAAVGMTVSV